jgi:hypothetical protein
MHVPKLKVRPRKGELSLIVMSFLFDVPAVKPYAPCREELAVMLGCWATSGDFVSLGQCAQAAQTLHHCMRTAVSFDAFTSISQLTDEMYLSRYNLK